MRFKKKDIFITKQLSEADIKTTLLPKLNDIQSKTNYTVKYFLNNWTISNFPLNNSFINISSSD